MAQQAEQWAEASTEHQPPGREPEKEERFSTERRKEAETGRNIIEEEEEEYFYLTLNKHYTNTGHHGNP